MYGYVYKYAVEWCTVILLFIKINYAFCHSSTLTLKFSADDGTVEINRFCTFIYYITFVGHFSFYLYFLLNNMTIYFGMLTFGKLLNL